MYLIPFLIGLSASAFLFFKVKETVLSKDGVGIAKYLMSLGYSKANSSGIAGNIFVESSYNPLAVGDNGTSFGLAQWHKTRWQRLNAWAKENNKNPNTFQGQLDYLDWELKNTEKKLKEKGCDWILANKVTDDNAFSSEKNKIFFFDKKKIDEWPKMKKKMVALKLTKKIVSFFKNNKLLSYEKNLL